MNTRYLLRYACIAVICIYVVLTLCGCQHPKAQVNVKPQAATTKLLFPESELPGKYYFGEGLLLNCYFELRTDHRFTYRWSSDILQYSDKGTWSLNSDVLTIHPDDPGVHQGLSIRFIPVKHDGDLILIDENKMPGFCVMWTDKDPVRAASFAGGYPHLLPCYFRVEKITKHPGSNRPVMPARYWDFYDNGTIRSKVIRTSDAGHAVIDKGSLNRVKPGMLFAMSNPGRIDIEVVSAGEHESEVRPIYYDGSNAVIKVGDSFTTGDHTGSPRLTSYRRFSEPPELSRRAVPKSGKSGKR